MNIEQLKKRADFAKALRNILDVNIEGQLVVAGGLVRDLWAAQVKGVDMQGSGDIDILLIGNAYQDLEEMAENIAEIPQLKELVRWVEVEKVNYSYERSEEYLNMDGRLYGVVQLQAALIGGEAVNVDILIYAPHIVTVDQAIETFNCNVNQFWFDADGVGHSLFDGTQPFWYRENEIAKDVERYEKCVTRYNLVADAAHPYQRIDGMSPEEVDAQLPM